MTHNDTYRDPNRGGWCGCCGNLKRGVDWWCARCRSHVATEGPLWDQTYFALTGRACPYDITDSDKS